MPIYGIRNILLKNFPVSTGISNNFLLLSAIYKLQSTELLRQLPLVSLLLKYMKDKPWRI